MLRVSTELRDKLKAKAKAEGRTLEWTANQAINEYIAPKPNMVQVVDKPHGVEHVSIVDMPNHPKPTHYKPTDDWGA